MAYYTDIEKFSGFGSSKSLIGVFS